MMSIRSKIITLTTDFGTEDGYVGAMKGRILSICSDVKIIDITHSIPKFSISFAAFTLQNFIDYFPDYSIHVVVVDPGVGSERKPILIQLNKKFVICPDNGVASLLYEKYENFKSYEIKIDWITWDISSTFHGRDIFAPAAAMLANGENISSIAKPFRGNLESFYKPIQLIGNNRIKLRVLHVDHFGNIITNLSRRQWEAIAISKTPRIRLKKGFIYGIHQSYSSVNKGELLLLWDSSGYLEIAQNQGNASLALNLKENDEIFLEY